MMQDRSIALQQAAVSQGKKIAAPVHLNSLYDLLYDQSGKSKVKNMNQKVVINGSTLELLESKGNAVSFQAVAREEAQRVFENLKWNKTLKIAQPVP